MLGDYKSDIALVGVLYTYIYIYIYISGLGGIDNFDTGNDIKKLS